MNDMTAIKHDKFGAYRSRKKAAGLREIRLWVPDLKNPEVKAQMKREAEILRGDADEKNAIDFIEYAMADTMKDVPY